MVATRVYGGLGNQMFQYAAGLGVAARLGTRLVADASWFRQVPETVGRTYQLSVFGIREAGARDRVALRVRRPRIVRESGPGYDPAIERIGDDVLLDGYWQSYRYFEHCEERVRAAFRFPPPSSGRATALLREIAASESVSVHVRRGDYLAPKRAARFGVLSLDYYRRAMDRVAREVGDPRFFVFSDDPEWCRTAFADVAAATVVESDEAVPPYEDMQLMSACRHHVVANSSFSWWGAWLDARPDAIVVAPEVWFRDPALGAATLVPPSWLRL